jgi:DNA polymerase I-like protein with 3'-5' exonuclease and polymerase domains
MNTYALDFETYYDKECSIKILGTQGYFNHPNFDAYMVTVWGSDGTRYVGDPRNFDWSILNGNRVLSHNASFDEGVYFHGVSKGWWPPALLAEWLCTSDMVAFLGLPRSLKGAVNTVFGIEISKDTRDNMKGKAWESMTPDFQKEVSDYALRDAEYCFNLWEKLGDKWPLRERKISAINRRIAQRGIPIDWDALQKNLGIINTALFNAESLIPWIEDYTPLSRKAFNAQCRKQNIEPPKSLAQASPEAAKWFEVNGAECVWAKAVSDYRRINSFKKKLESFQGGTLGDGRYYGGFLYFGASTGRFSGSGGNLNLQNLPRGEMFGVDFRKMIKTPEGRALVVVDLSQIEVRTLCHLAGDTKALQLIKESEDIYHAFGVLLGLHDPANGQLKKYDPVLRHKVKSIVLGCGYGMGVDRFAEFSGLDENEAATAVNLYRKRMKSVVNLWGHYDEGINFSIAAGEEFSVEIASSRVLGYGRIKKMKDFKTGKFTNVGKIMRQGRLMDFRLWGGVITENASQGLARDIFSDMMVRVEEAGYDCIMHVHDELIVEVDEDKAELALKEILAIMSTPPEWIPDIPLSAEGQIMTEYTK